jgi:hypothetical protein
MVLSDLRGREPIQGGLCDLHLLAMHRGRERDLVAWTKLLFGAGFAIEQLVDLGSVPRAIIARPT